MLVQGTLTPDHSPICRANAMHVVCSGRATLSVVVLRTAINIVERLTVVQCELVVLGDRQVFHVTPVPHMKETLREPLNDEPREQSAQTCQTISLRLGWFPSLIILAREIHKK